MPFDLSKRLVIATSTRALFDLSVENKIFDESGVAAYNAYQLEHRGDVLRAGVSFSLVRTMLLIGQQIHESVRPEVIVVSRTSPAVTERVRASIEHYQLGISRFVYTSGDAITPHLHAMNTALFLSANVQDVNEAHRSGIASGLIAGNPDLVRTDVIDTELRLAFDGDGVFFDDESESINQDSGLAAFREHEHEHRDTPLNEGPFAGFLRTVHALKRLAGSSGPQIRIGLVTARDAPSDVRVSRTLESWGIELDFAAFLGGVNKSPTLQAFRPHIFFDDHPDHCMRAAGAVPTAQVPSSNFAPHTEGVPDCPICGREMTRRTARRGRRAGADFWGCSAYPECKATIHIH